MSLILDAGALIAFESGSRDVASLVKVTQARRQALRTSTAVVAQVWRDPRRQVTLGKLLRGVEEVPLTSARARLVGELLRRSRTADVADATLVELASDGDEILTGDVDDLELLARHSGKTIAVLPVG